MSPPPEPADPVLAAGPVRPPPPRSPRERLSEIVEPWRASPRTVLVAVAVFVGAAGAGWWLLRPPAAPIEQRLPRAPTTAAAGSSGASGGPPSGVTETSQVGGLTPTTAGHVVVEAAGAVRRPGVYRLPAGSRVDDLVRAAGGLAPGADADRLNLAAPVGDGERLYVPKPGQEPPAAVGVDGPSGAAGDADPAGAREGSAGAPTPSAPVDLNSAGAAELDTLPGVGPATAQAILAYRQQHGPFHSVDELLQVRGIGPAKLDQLRPMATVDG